MKSALVLSFVLVLTVPVFAGCVNPTDAATSDSVTPVAAGFVSPILVTGHLYETFQVVNDLGSLVNAEVYLPDPAKAVDGALVPEKLPAVLLASPYNNAGYGPNPEVGWAPYDYLFDELLLRGYAIVVGDSAAMGGSGGCWDFMGPVDQSTAVALVEGIAAQPWSNGKVGMTGLSYDGMTQIMAASRVAEHLVTVVPAAPLTHAYAGLYMGGVHYGDAWWQTTEYYTQSGATPPGTSTERYPGYIESVAAAPECAVEANAYGNEPTGTYNAYYQERDFRPLAGDVKASVFYIQGFADGAVKPDNFGEWFNGITAPKKAWLGHWNHEYPIAEVAGRDDMYVTLTRWFDHWLKDIANGMDQELGVEVQDSNGEWRAEPVWPPADAAPTAFALGANRVLGTEATAGTGQFGPSTITPAADTTQLELGALTFTQPITESIHISGRPMLNLTVSSDRPAGQVIAKLYESSDAGLRLISQGAWNLMLGDDMKTAAPLTPGQQMTVGFGFYPTEYVLTAGHELVLKLYTTEGLAKFVDQSQNQWYHSDNSGATLTVALGPESGSFLTLPTVARGADSVIRVGCGYVIAPWVAECYDADLKDLSPESK